MQRLAAAQRRVNAAGAASRFQQTLARAFSAAPLRVAVVGSGPSGLYPAKYLMKDHPGCHVDVLDALPTPYGA